MKTTEDILDYLLSHDITVKTAVPNPSFIDPGNELQGDTPYWASLAKQTQDQIDLSSSGAEAMSLASMVAVHQLDLQPNDVVLDVCSAPGMKSLYALTISPKIRLTCTDISSDRLRRLERLLKKHNKTAIIKKVDASIKSQNSELYDKILVDAPCSGEGVILAGNKNLLKAWSSAKVKRLQQLQIKILKNAYSQLKPGGTLIYATCTLNKNENERVIHKALKIDVAVTESVLSLENLPTIQSNQAWRILPSENSIGFFVAKINKSV